MTHLAALHALVCACRLGCSLARSHTLLWRKHLQGTWRWGYKISASVIYFKNTVIYLWGWPSNQTTVWRNKEWQSQLIPHWEDFRDRHSILDLEEKDCGVHLAKDLLATEAGSAGLRQPLATALESWLHAVFLGSGWSDQIFGEAYFSRRSFGVIPPPCPVDSPRITHLTISGFKGAVVVSIPDVRNHIIEKCLKYWLLPFCLESVPDVCH